MTIIVTDINYYSYCYRIISLRLLYSILELTKENKMSFQVSYAQSIHWWLSLMYGIVTYLSNMVI